LAIEGVRATQELFKASESKIIKVNVKELVCENNMVKGVRTDDEVIYDNEVVITAGLGTPDLLSTIDIHFEMRSSLGLLAYTNPLPSLLNYPITGFDFHARQDDKGRLIIGGRFDDDVSNVQNILDYFTLGSRPLPIDGRPKIGRLVNSKGQKINGIYLAVMHSGITNAPLAGKLGIDEVVTGKRNNLIQDFFPQTFYKSENFHDV
jgi:glycine/D-amino acid oxidase-like deaminating enzyme